MTFFYICLYIFILLFFFSGMDTAVYSGASYQPKYSPSSTTPSIKLECPLNAVTTAYQNKKPYHFQNRQRMAPKTPQLHYCDVCKISCAGPQVLLINLCLLVTSMVSVENVLARSCSV